MRITILKAGIAAVLAMTLSINANATSSSDFDASRTYSPSAEAKAAYQFATSGSTWEGFTRTGSQIAGAYENLPSDAFPFQPFAKCGDWYYQGPGTSTEKFCDNALKILLMTLVANSMESLNDNLWTKIATLPNGKSGYLPRREIASSVYCSLFAADPYSPVALRKWATVLMIDRHVRFSSAYQLEMNAESAYSSDAIDMFWSKREDLCTDIATTVTPWKVIKDFLLECSANLQDAEANGNTTDIIKNKMLFEAMWENVVAYRDENKSDNGIQVAKARVDKVNLYEIAESLKADSADPVNMPAAVSMDSNSTNALQELVREAYGDKVVKAYFTTSNWHVFKNPEFPYNIRHRSVDAVIIVKEGSKYYMYTRAFIQRYNGSEYTSNYAIQAPAPDPGKQPVNYK